MSAWPWPAKASLICIGGNSTTGTLNRARVIISTPRACTTEIVVLEDDQQTVALRLEKGWSFFTSKLAVFDAQGRKLGSLRNKLFSLSGKILVEDADERPIGEFSGGVFSWTRQLKDPAGVVIGTMDKKWAGIGKELFTSADNYHLEVAPEFAGQPAKVALLLAACLAYDVIFAEN